MFWLTAIAVLASVLVVAAFTVVFAAPPSVWPKYYIPGIVVPLCVAPVLIHLLLDLAFALDAAHTTAARQQRELERVQRLDLVGRLASSLAHELNNVLTVVRASVDALGGAAVNDELAAIDDAAQRGARMTRRLLSIGRDEEITRVRQPVAPVLHDAVRVVRRILPPSIQFIEPTDVPTVPLDLDADAVQHAILNLVLNARDAIEGDGSITISADRQSIDAHEWVVIAVQDTGRGMAAELLEHVTEPFVTTKAAHQGTGLGLTIVRRSMEQHGGHLTLTSRPGHGTCVALMFPVPEMTAEQRDPELTVAPIAPALPAPAVEHVGYGHVLLVDDEADVRQVTTRVLERAGYRVTSVADAPTARRCLAEHPSVDVIVTDVMMPGTTGLDLLQQLRAVDDRTPMLLVSGFSVERVDEITATDRTVRFLAKPWTPGVLLAHVADLAVTTAEP